MESYTASKITLSRTLKSLESLSTTHSPSQSAADDTIMLEALEVSRG